MKERLTFEREIALQTGAGPESELAPSNLVAGPSLALELPAMANAPALRPASGATCDQRRATSQGLALKEPFSRPCCILKPSIPVVGDQALSIADAAPHYYGENKYVFGDEKNGYVYTCRGGFVDLGHAREWLDWTAYLAVHAKALLPSGGTLELTCEGPSTRTIKFAAQREKRSDELCVYLAQRIAYEMAIWHELITGIVKVQPDSLFSPEDNYSNLVGTYMGREALLRFGRKPFNQAAALGIRHWLKRLGAVSQSRTRSAFAATKDDWWQDSSPLLLKRHFGALGSVTPMLAPGICPGARPFALPVPTIVRTPQRPGQLVKTDLRKLYELKLGLTPWIQSHLAGTQWAAVSDITPADYARLIAHVKANI